MRYGLISSSTFSTFSIVSGRISSLSPESPNPLLLTPSVNGETTSPPETSSSGMSWRNVDGRTVVVVVAAAPAPAQRAPRLPANGRPACGANPAHSGAPNSSATAVTRLTPTIIHDKQINHVGDVESQRILL